MAASASNSKTLSANYGSYTLSVSWSESSPSVSTNKSTISASATLSSSNTAFDSGSDAESYLSHISVYWFDNNTYKNGVKIDGTDFRSCGMSPYGSRSASGSISVPHKDDGTLSGYCVTYFTNNNGGPYAPASNSCSTDSKSLTTIARASQPSINTWPNNSPNFTLGDRIVIHMNRKSDTFTHTVYFKYGNASVQVGTAKGVTNNVAFETSTVKSQIMALIPTSTSYSNVVEAITYSGNTVIGSKTASYTAKVDTTVEHPNIGTITIQDINARTSAITQDDNIYIANISTLEATIPLTVSGSYTELASATVTCGNKTQTYTLSGTSQTITFTFDKVNVSSLSVTVKDKRGTSRTSSKSWTLIQYQPITLTATVGRPSATGSAGVGQITGMAYGGEFGATQNSVNVAIDFKLHDAPDYDPSDTETDSFALTQSGYNQYTKSYSFAYQFGYQYQYDVRFTISDLFSTAVYTAQMMQGLPIMSWDENEVDIFGDLHIHDRNDPYLWQDVVGGLSASALNVQPNGNSASTYTQNGITVTLHADRSLTINGTATNKVFYNLNIMTNYEAGVTYRLRGFRDQYVDGISACVRPNSTETTLCRAYRDDATFVAPNEPVFTYVFVDVGVTCNNVKYYPQIVDARYAVQEYQLYKPFQPLVVDAWTSSTNYTAKSSTGTVMRSRNIAYLDAGKYLFIGGGAFYVSNYTGTMRMVITAGGVTKMSRTLCGTNSQNNTNSASGMIIWQNEEALTNVTIQCVLTTQQSGMTTTAPSYRQRWYCMMRLDDSSTVNDVYV